MCAVWRGFWVWAPDEAELSSLCRFSDDLFRHAKQKYGPESEATVGVCYDRRGYSNAVVSDQLHFCITHCLKRWVGAHGGGICNRGRFLMDGHFDLFAQLDERWASRLFPLVDSARGLVHEQASAVGEKRDAAMRAVGLTC